MRIAVLIATMVDAFPLRTLAEDMQKKMWVVRSSVAVFQIRLREACQYIEVVLSRHFPFPSLLQVVTSHKII